MKKKVVQLAVVAVLLAGMVAALVFLRKAPPAEVVETSAEEHIYAIGGEFSPEPKEIAVQMDSGNYTLVNTDPGAEPSTYTLKGWESFSLDSYGLGGAFANAKAMEAKRIVVENPGAQELEAYGLKEPRAVVGVKPVEGADFAFQVGADAPGGEGAYVMNMQNATVYLVSPQAVEPFLKNAVAYINPAITPIDEDQKGFNRITLSGSDYPEPIVIDRTPDNAAETAGVVLRTHEISSPVKAGLDSQKGLTPLGSVFGLSSSEVLAVGDDTETLETYHLKEPACIVSVVTENPNTTFTLRISETDADGNCTAIKSGSPVIYRLPASSMPWLGLSLFDMREKLAIMPFVDELAEIELFADGMTYTFALSGEGESLTVMLDGKELPGATKEDGTAVSATTNFRQFYQTLISARYDEEIPARGAAERPEAQELPEPEQSDASEKDVEAAEAPVPEADADEASSTAEAADFLASPDAAADATPLLLTITYKYRDTGKSPDVVSFYPGPTRRVIIVLNDGTPFYTQSIYVDHVCEDAQKLAAGQPVKSYL